MENILKMILDFISTLVPQKAGTKFLVALSGIGSIVYMAVKEIGEVFHVIAIVIFVIVYFIADLISKRLAKPEEKEGDV